MVPLDTYNETCMFKVKIGKYFRLRIFLLNLPLTFFYQIFRMKAYTNLYVGIIIYDRISTNSAPVIIYFPFKHLPSKNPKGNPDKPLPISCHQTHTLLIITHGINGQ